VPEEAILGRIETVLRKAEFEEGFSGVVSVSQGNKVLLERSYGWADAEREIPATLDRKFMIASISKSFVAASILKLEEQGKLSTHDMIGKYLPGYPSWASDQISIHHLLTHTSGIRDYINDRKLWFKMRQVADWTPTPDDLVQTFANKPLFFFPGTRFRYSNSGYVLLAKIVEIVSQTSFQSFVERNILLPLGMDHTGFGANESPEKWAIAYRMAGNKPKSISNFKSEWIYGMGGMHSTASDMRKWIQGLWGGKVLSAKSLGKMTSAYQHGYGYGWHVQDFYGKVLVGHGGYLPGWNSYVYSFPQDAVSIVVLSNSEQAVPLELCNRIGRIILLNALPSEGENNFATLSGRYEFVGELPDYFQSPLASDVVTISENGLTLSVKAGGGRPSQLIPLASGEWTDPIAGFVIRFSSENGGLVTLDQNGRTWQWRKIRGATWGGRP
jgi:CubicO group peptidase (beta-lactamase class C family)